LAFINIWQKNICYTWWYAGIQEVHVVCVWMMFIYIASCNFNYNQNDHNLCVIASNFKSNYYEVELKLDVLESEN
jgi:hypothetical protein